MKELISYIVAQLVDHPEKVQVNEETAGNRIDIHLRVDTEDRGKIIGKHGRVINAVRAVVGVVAAKKNAQISIEVLD